MGLDSSDMKESYAEDRYQALYLINNRLDNEWEHTYRNDSQRIVYMTAEQRNNFDEVTVYVDDTFLDERYERSHNEKSYEWDGLPSEYVRMINKWYHVHTDTGVSHFRNYESIVSYAEMVKNLVSSGYDIEVGTHGEIDITVPLKDKLTDYSRDIHISNDGNGYELDCQIRHSTDSFYTELFYVKLDDIPELIRKATAYDKLKDALIPFMTRLQL